MSVRTAVIFFCDVGDVLFLDGIAFSIPALDVDVGVKEKFIVAERCFLLGVNLGFGNDNGFRMTMGLTSIVTTSISSSESEDDEDEEEEQDVEASLNEKGNTVVGSTHSLLSRQQSLLPESL